MTGKIQITENFNCLKDELFPMFDTDRARDTKSDEVVALKKVRMDKEKDGKSTVLRLR